MREKALSKFAQLFDYPNSGTKKAVCEIYHIVKESMGDGEVIEDLWEFKKYIENTELGYMEEIYTHSFDLNPKVSLYVGYHLFGESYKRGDFLVGLKGVYSKKGFSYPSFELPDHMKVILSFLGKVGIEDPEARVIVEEALFPSIDLLEHSFNGNDSPYLYLIRSLKAYLQERIKEVADG